MAGAYSWAVIFDDEADKLRYANELVDCLNAYTKKVDALTWNLLALSKENGSIPAAVKEISKLYCQMIVIRNISNALIANNKNLEYDFVFMTERDQGVGKFLGQGPCLEIAEAPAYIKYSTTEILKSWIQKSSGSGASGKPALRSIN